LRILVFRSAQLNIRAQIFGRGGAAQDPLVRAKQPRGAKSEELNSVTVPREERRRGNNRAVDRHRLTEELVQITHEGVSRQGQLVNLSGGGAMVGTDLEVKLWDRVDLHLGDHGTIECAVRWIRDGRIGLEFAHETRLDCSADDQATLLRDAISRSFPDIQHFDGPEPESGSRSTQEHRSASRHPLIWSGVLHHDYQSTAVRVRNISATGARIETKSPVRVGSEPVLELGDSISLSATVEWVVGDQVGVRFHSLFDMSQLGRARPEVTPNHWLRPAYLDKVEADSAWDPRWHRLSVGELKHELEGFLKR
jgi:PilZ domain-containing protein